MTASAEVQFKVSLTRMGGMNIGGGAATHDPYLKWNFDNFKDGKTGFRKATASPVWEDSSAEFTYATRYATRLPAKELVIEVWDKNTLTADKLVGDGRIDLFTLFTGPVHVEIPIVDKGHVDRGVVYMDVTVTQFCNSAFSVTGLALDWDEESAADTATARLGWSMPSAMQTTATLAYTGPGLSGSGSTFTCTSEVRTSPFTATASELFLGAMVISAATPSGKAAAAWLPLHQHYSYDGDCVRFEADMLSQADGSVVGTASGELRFQDLPTFVQMVAGKLAASGRIEAGVHFLPDVPKRPVCRVELDPSSPGSLICRDASPAGVVCGMSSNKRALRLRGGGGSGSSAARRGSLPSAPAAADVAAAEGLSSRFKHGVSISEGSAGSGGSGSAASAPPLEDAAARARVTEALLELQTHVGSAGSLVDAGGQLLAQLDRAAEERAGRSGSAEAKLRELRSAVEEATATVARLQRSGADFAARAGAAEAAAARWPAGSSQALTLRAEAERLRASEEELVHLRGVAESGLPLRQAAAAKEVELQTQDGLVAEQEAGLAANLRSLIAALRSRLAEAQALVAASASLAATADVAGAVGRISGAAAALQTAAAYVRSALEGHRGAGVENATRLSMLTAERDRVLASVEQATSALVTAEADINARADAADAAARAGGVEKLMSVDAATIARLTAPAAAAPAPAPAAAAAAAGGAAVVLPGCWSRHVAPGDGRPYFQNDVTRVTVWTLPTLSQYEVTWPAPTPLGIRLEELDYPENPYYKACSLLQHDAAAGHGAIGTENMGPGHILLAANGAPLLGQPLAHVLAVVSSMPRPLSLRLYNPHAVPPHVAAAAADLRVTVEKGPQPALLPPLPAAPPAAAPAPMPYGAGGAAAYPGYPPGPGYGGIGGGYPAGPMYGVAQGPYGMPGAAGFPVPGGYGAAEGAGYEGAGALAVQGFGGAPRPGSGHLHHHSHHHMPGYGGGY